MGHGAQRRGHGAQRRGHGAWGRAHGAWSMGHGAERSSNIAAEYTGSGVWMVSASGIEYGSAGLLTQVNNST
jgi:hypothetical protein